MWDTARVLTSFRLDGDGRFLIGSIGRLDRRMRGWHANWAKRAARFLFPQLKGISFEHGWFGTIGTTSDHLPRLTELDRGVIAIFGFNGRGIGPGTVFGEAIANYLVNHDPASLPLPVKPIKSERLRGLRSNAIEFGVKAYHLVRHRF